MNMLDHWEGNIKDYLWVAYRNMINRCHRGVPYVDERTWANYGGRGIKVCEQWRRDFQVFVRDVGERPAKGYELNRINNEGPYEPSNVGWVTRKENCNNTRRNVHLTYKGETLTLSQWRDRLGTTIYNRVVIEGWTLERAISGERLDSTPEQRKATRMRSWVTRRANGEVHRNAKLDASKVREIRSKYIPGKYGYTRLAKEYGVSADTMRSVCLGLTWRHVD